MSPKREHAAIIGAGVAACAVCCAGPLLGVLAAIGLGTAAGIVLFGAGAVLVGAVAVGFVLLRRRRRRVTYTAEPVAAPVPVELTGTRARP